MERAGCKVQGFWLLGCKIGNAAVDGRQKGRAAGCTPAKRFVANSTVVAQASFWAGRARVGFLSLSGLGESKKGRLSFPGVARSLLERSFVGSIAAAGGGMKWLPKLRFDWELRGGGGRTGRSRGG